MTRAMSLAQYCLLFWLTAVLVDLVIHVDSAVRFPSPPFLVRIADDGQHVIVAYRDRVEVFESQTGRRIAHFHCRIDTLDISRTGTFVAISHSSGQLTRFTYRNRASWSRTKLADSCVAAFSLSDNGKQLFTVDDEGYAQLVRLHDGSIIQGFNLRIGGIDVVEMSPVGNTVAVGASTQTGHALELWDAEAGIANARLSGAEYCYVSNLDFSLDGQRIALALSVPVVRVFSVQDLGQCLELRGISGRKAIDFSTDSNRVLAADDQHLGVWDIQTGERLLWIADRYPTIRDARFLPDADEIIFVTEDGAIRQRSIDGAERSIPVRHLGFQPAAVPWVTVLGYGVWLALWIKVQRHTPSAASHSDTEITVWLLPASSGFAVTNLILIVVAADSASCGSNPIYILTLLVLLSFLILTSFCGWLLYTSLVRRSPMIVIPSLLVHSFTLAYNLYIFGLAASV